MPRLSVGALFLFFRGDAVVTVTGYMDERKNVFRPLKEIFNNIESCLSSRCDLTDEFRNELKKETSDKSDRRTFIALIFTEIIKLAELIYSFVGYDTKNEYFYVYVWSSVSILLIVLSYLLFYYASRKKRAVSLKTRRTVSYIVWLLLTVASLFDSFAELNTDMTMTRLTIMSFGLAIVPIMSLSGIVPLVAVNLVANICCAVYIDMPAYRIQYIVVISLLSLVCSFAQYVSNVNILRERFAMYDKNRRLSELAEKDPLTKALNRRGLRNMIDRFYDPKVSCAVFMLDIDFFKLYNDMYFHDAGDECLKKIAAAIEKCVFRKDDLVARYGGEEFLVCIFDIESHSVISVARRIQMEIAKLRIDFKLEGKREYVTVSIGIAHSAQCKEYNFNDLVSCADMELYHAKNNGRNCISFDGEIYKNTSIVSPESRTQVNFDLSQGQRLKGFSERKTVLIVDDQPANLELLKKIVSSDYDVITAVNGMDALDVLSAGEHKIDGVLLDLFMPIMDGFTFLSEIREAKLFGNLPIIVITGINDSENEKRSLMLGAWDYISKPYDATIIKFRLNNAITMGWLLTYIKSNEADVSQSSKRKILCENEGPHVVREIVNE